MIASVRSQAPFADPSRVTLGPLQLASFRRRLGLCRRNGAVGLITGKRRTEASSQSHNPFVASCCTVTGKAFIQSHFHSFVHSVTLGLVMLRGRVTVTHQKCRVSPVWASVSCTRIYFFRRRDEAPFAPLQFIGEGAAREAVVSNVWRLQRGGGTDLETGGRRPRTSQWWTRRGQA